MWKIDIWSCGYSTFLIYVCWSRNDVKDSDLTRVARGLHAKSLTLIRSKCTYMTFDMWMYFADFLFNFWLKKSIFDQIRFRVHWKRTRVQRSRTCRIRFDPSRLMYGWIKKYFSSKIIKFNIRKLRKNHWYFIKHWS